MLPSNAGGVGQFEEVGACGDVSSNPLAKILCFTDVQDGSKASDGRG